MSGEYGRRPCGSCGARVRRRDHFCPRCGHPMNHQPATSASAPIIAANLLPRAPAAAVRDGGYDVGIGYRGPGGTMPATGQPTSAASVTHRAPAPQSVATPPGGAWSADANSYPALQTPPPPRRRGPFVTLVVLLSVAALALGGLIGVLVPRAPMDDTGQGVTSAVEMSTPEGVHIVVSGLPGPLGHAGTLTETTTSEFATNIAQAYADSGAAGASAQVSAYSPTTERTYELDCEPQGDKTVICTGGRNARVILWP